MKRIVILTGSELRHTYFRKFMASSDIDVAASYCEGMENTVHAVVESDENNAARKQHLAAREKSERDFFQAFVTSTPDRSHPHSIARGEINQPRIADEIIQLKP